jgi:hypothetical protein
VIREANPATRREAISMTVARQSHPSPVAIEVMSPHHRVLIFAAPAVKSRRIASARAAAAGSGVVVFVRRLAGRPLIPAARISRATRLRAGPRPFRRSPAWIRGAP